MACRTSIVTAPDVKVSIAIKSPDVLAGASRPQQIREAIEWARRLMVLHQQHMPEWEGECEIRQLAE